VNEDLKKELICAIMELTDRECGHILEQKGKVLAVGRVGYSKECQGDGACEQAP